MLKEFAGISGRAGKLHNKIHLLCDKKLPEHKRSYWEFMFAYFDMRFDEIEDKLKSLRGRGEPSSPASKSVRGGTK